MKQLIILQQVALDSFLASTTPENSTLLLLCAPCDVNAGQLCALSESSTTVYWLCSQTEPLPFGQHSTYDKWAELSVQCDRSFFWPA